MEPHPADMPASPAPPTAPAGPTVVPVVQKIIFEHPRRSRWIFWLVVLALLISLLYNVNLAQRYKKYLQPHDQLAEEFHSLKREADDKIAIIRIEEMIYDTDGFVMRQIRQATADNDVKAVVLRIDSPGGTMVASDYLYHQLVKMRDAGKDKLPIVVSMGGLCASGGYYLAMAVGDRPDSIYAEPATWCGSIGVVIPHYNLSGLMEEHKIVDDTLASNPLKTLGSFTQKMTDEERAILQNLVDQGYARFKEVVAAGRPALGADEALMNKVATGAVFTTKDAIENKLVDQQGFLDDAIAAAAKAAGLDPKEARAIQYKRPEDVFEALLGGSSAAGRSDLERLAEMASPRAYYMWTLLPGWELLSSRRD